MNVTELLTILWQGFPKAAEFINPSYPRFLQLTGGLQLSLLIAICSFLLAIVPAFILAILRQKSNRQASTINKIVTSFFSVIAKLLTEILRGIPIMTLALLFFYLPYPLFKLRVPPILLAIAAFTIYTSAYMTEIFRSGFNAVNKNTIEAAKLLGLSSFSIFFRIRLPIAIRTMVPTLVNLFITIFKDTSVLTALAVGELTYTSRLLFVSAPGNYTLILILVVSIYWAVSFLGSKAIKILESKTLIGSHK